MAHLGPWEYDAATNLFTFNDAFYAVFRTSAEREGGYQMSPQEYAQRFCHPDDAPLVEIESRKALETDDPDYNRQIEHRIIYADGEPGWISVRFLILKDESGRTIKTFGVNQDITERKQAEEALRESEQRYRLIANHTSDAIWAMDSDFRFTLFVLLPQSVYSVIPLRNGRLWIGLSSCIQRILAR